MNKNVKVLGILGASLALYSCGQTTPPEARVTDLVHGIAKKLPVHVSGSTFDSSEWTSAERNEAMSALVQSARVSSVFKGAQRELDIGLQEAASTPPLLTGLPDLLKKVGEDGGGAGGGGSTLSSSPGSIGGGSLPSAPQGTGPGASLPSGPGSMQASFNPTPALFAVSRSGPSSGGSLAAGYCSVFEGILNFLGRCSPEFASIKAVADAQFGGTFCRANLAPVFEQVLEQQGNIPAGLADTLACLGDGFKRASCPAGTNLSPGLEAALSSCGIEAL